MPPARAHSLPPIIQGGMGAGISDWRLARAVARTGQFGVVSGTALDLLLARRLQRGDPDGAMRRGLAAFPDQAIAERILERWFIPGGKAEDAAYSGKPLTGATPSREAQELLVASAFVEVHLARAGHEGPIGINFLHKIQAPLLPALWGAMLAGVDAVLIGAGIPLQIPAVLDAFAAGLPAEFELDVRDADTAHRTRFDPADFLGTEPPALPRPRFLPIISSLALARMLVRKCGAGVDGLVIEGSTAGGHNAPPRARTGQEPGAEPVYGPRDRVDLRAIAELGRPFWLAGSFGTPSAVSVAQAAGAAGVQVGTLFAFCQESGLRDDLKERVLEQCRTAPPRPRTDARASPTGFPFKVLPLAGTLSDDALYAQRRRRCDLGYLREAYQREDGSVGWRCPAEHPDAYVAKGGAREDTVGRKCLCNALAANVGLGQRRGDAEELPLLTTGEELAGIRRLLGAGARSYSASEVVDFLLAALPV